MGPRVYNLFPTLAGPIDRWADHFDRIAAMGFDWVYVNPIHVTGGSGSLYAVADYYRLNPILRGGDTRPDDALVREFIAQARARGLGIMLDLVINHTANDAPLVGKHPEWYARAPDGTPKAPSAVDPDDPKKITVWGDLAELDYRERPARAELIAFMCDVVRHYVALGATGFRCDAAYQVPGDVWALVIAAARERGDDILFAAETLGCRPEAVAQLRPAGFDYLFNSSKWWDFREPWLLEQYEAFRHIAPSIAFPESHDTPRLAAQIAERGAPAIEAEYRFRYLFAAFFSSGVMMPMGYEYGFARKLDVVRTRPEDWETPRFDLSAFIAEVNAMKARLPVLNEEGAERALPAGRAVVLLRRGASSNDAALAVINPRARKTIDVDAAALAEALDGTPRDVTPAAGATAPLPPSDRVRLGPLEMRVFVRASEHGRNGRATPPDSRHDTRADARAVVIENVSPAIDAGRHPIKRIVGDDVLVECDAFRDGHDTIAGMLRHRLRGEDAWNDVPLEPLGNDRWRARFRADRAGALEYVVEAWPDAFASWAHDAVKKRDAGQSLAVELIEGRALLDAVRSRAEGAARERLDRALAAFDASADDAERVAGLLADDVAAAAATAPDRSRATVSATMRATIERPAARFSAWYEFFPRSQGAPGTHGTFADAAARLPAIASMGFDVVYLPPIHPIGNAHRKGKNNALKAGPDDPGSPWAIGNADGGHTAVEPKLGTLADFDTFVAAARAAGLDVALDYALQCSPDHPFVRDHPEWFSFRPDGTLKYAENPPKKYQDIVNFNWYGAHAAALRDALRDIVTFWIGHGVRIFRVDNPHTKPFAFWEWMIADVRAAHPDVIFLAEAFTRPKVMRELAKIGFSQSYTYFTWRTSKAELTEYATELAATETAEYFRPNFWPNTPDILPPHLQLGGRAAFRSRLVLAATLASNYGIYSGYELCENAALPGREEYLDSEKYEIKVRDWNAPGNLSDEIARVNRIRRENPALHDWRNVAFYRADDDDVIFYGKRTGTNMILVAVNLDPFAAHDPLLWLPTGDLGIADDEPYAIEELLGGTAHLWRGSPHHWRLDPQTNPAAIFRITLENRTVTA